MYQYSVFLMHVNNRYLLCICQCRISNTCILISSISDSYINTHYLLCIYQHPFLVMHILISSIFMHVSLPITYYAYINIKYFWFIYQYPLLVMHISISSISDACISSGEDRCRGVRKQKGDRGRATIQS